jgi:transcriptional regulator with XRE-family HTH domain
MPKLKEARIEAGYTQRTLAEALDTSARTIGNWERGSNRPHPGNGRRLADLLAVPARDLLAPERENGDESQ